MVSLRAVLGKLKIKPEEFRSLIRLIFLKSPTVEKLEEIFENLGINSTSASNMEGQNDVKASLFSEMILIREPIDEMNILLKSQDFASLQKRTKELFTITNLASYGDYAFVISRLVAGDFLVLESYSHLFSEADGHINMIMSLCGTINPSESYTTPLLTVPISGQSLTSTLCWHRIRRPLDSCRLYVAYCRSERLSSYN